MTNENQPYRKNIKSIAIVGGGAAGWMCAAALSKVVGVVNCRILLVESAQIGTVGVGEATIPQISIFNNVLGFDEVDFVKSTQATFKLGIEFVNWGAIGERYMHPFSTFGNNIDNVQFYHYWQKARQMGRVSDLYDYSLNVQASRLNRFMRAANVPNSPLSKIAYAFHFDANLYANYLRTFSEKRGVERIEGIVKYVELDHESGFIKAVRLENCQRIEG